jgi:Ribonuclease G/E
MLGGFMRHPEVEKYLKETCRKAGQSKSKKKIKSCLKNLEKAWARTRALKKERQDGQ